MLEHVQCIILIGSGRRQFERSQRTCLSSTTTVHALLPKIFTDLRPEISDFFRKNNIQVVENSTNPKDLFTNARKPYQLDIFEMKLINIDVKHEITEPTVHVTEYESSREVARLLFAKCIKGISSAYLEGEAFTYCAIDDRSVQFLGACLSHGSLFGYRHYYGGTVLHFAIKKNSMALLKMFLRNGYAVDAPDSNGWTPLHHAAAKGRFQMVKTLLQSGANVNVVANESKPENGGKTPLNLAAKYNYSEIVKLLLENNADVNAEDHCTEADCRCEEHHGITPLCLAAERGHLEVVEAPARVPPGIDGISIDDYFIHCSTPLLYAADHGNLEIVNLLLERGANVNGIQNLTSGNEDGIDGGPASYTALHVAAANGRVEIIKYLLDQGANVDGKSNNESTPIIDAAENGHTEVVILLIEAGANMNAECRNYLEEEFDLLIIALRKKNQKLLDILLSHRSKLSSKCIIRAFYFALVSSSPFCCENVNSICTDGFIFSDDNLQNVDEVALFFGAIHKNRQDLVEQLLSRGVNVNGQYTWGKRSITPLHLAAASNIDGKIVNVLVNHGANVNMLDGDGSTIATYAVHNSNMNALKTLIERKSNIRGDSEALFGAVKLDDMKILETLLINGMDTRNSLPDHPPATALQLAAAKKDLQKLKLLLKFSSFPRKSGGHDAECDEFPELLLTMVACNFKSTEVFLTLLDFFFHDDCYVNSIVWYVIKQHPNSHWSKAVGHHVVKVVSVGLRDGCEAELVDRQLLGEEEGVADYRSSCETEVEKLKNTKVGGTDISFVDILNQGIRRISNYLRNTSIEREFHTSSYETQFPLYGSILKWQLEKGAHRRFLINRGIRIFAMLFEYFSALPFDLKEKIVDYLDNQDLQMLICI